ncbi:hypothetical protein ACJX0J_036276, partial [Zea mays]
VATLIFLHFYISFIFSNQEGQFSRGRGTEFYIFMFFLMHMLRENHFMVWGKSLFWDKDDIVFSHV